MTAKSQTDIRIAKYSLVVTVVGLLLSGVGIWVGYYVPKKLDTDARERERNRICVESVIDLRAAMNRIESGYIAAADARPERLDDWDAGEQAIERTRVACRDVALPSARGVEEVKDLWSQYDTERNAAKQGTPALAVTDAVRRWTTASILDLTAAP